MTTNILYPLYLEPVAIGGTFQLVAGETIVQLLADPDVEIELPVDVELEDEVEVTLQSGVDVETGDG